MLSLLKNSIVFALVVAIIITALVYLDSKICDTPKDDIFYIKLFVSILIVTYLLLQFYHVPKKILTEIIDVGPANF